MTDRLDEIKQRAEAATPGPWRWRGNTDNKQIRLQTPYMHGMTVMDFERWGMQRAVPRFAVGGLMHKAHGMVAYEVAPHAETREDPSVYRADITAIRHPDAEFIAASRDDVNWLVAEVERLRQYAEATKYHQDQHAAAVRELEKFRADHTEVAAVEFEEMARALYRRADNLPLADDSQVTRLGDFREIADKLMARADALRGAR